MDPIDTGPFDRPTPSALLDRVPPHALDAERHVLGAVLVDNNAYYSVSHILREEDFYHPAHQTIFRGILAVMQREGRVDPVTLADFLAGLGLLQSVGGVAYIESLADTTPTAANAESHARLVSEKARKRRMIELGHRMAREGFDASLSSEDLAERVETELIELSRSARTTEVVPIGDVIGTTLDLIEQRTKQRTAVTGVPTGIDRLDEMTGGLHPGQLIILAGRTSHGKTVLALNIAHHVATRAQLPVLMFSLEMTRDELAMRLLCSDAMVNAKDVQRGFVHDEDWSRLIESADILGRAPLYLDDNAALTPMELRGKARRLKSSQGLGLIIVDYLQLMNLRQRIESRQQEIAMISRALKVMAKDLDVPVVALSQLSRKVEDRGRKRPQLSDLRESGALEQDADVVLFVFRKDRLGETTQGEELGPAGQTTAELIIGKQRNGPIGIVPVVFLPQCMRFVNMDMGHHDVL